LVGVAAINASRDGSVDGEAIESLVPRWRSEAADSADDRTRELAARVENLSAELRAAVRELHGSRSLHRDLSSTPASTNGFVVDDLLRIAGVDRVRAEREELWVDTTWLHIVDGPRAHAIGRFRIRASPVIGVRIERLEAPEGVTAVWPHPHVQGDLPCLGNLRVGIEKLVAVGDLVPMVALLIEFLESYDAETAYCDISAWPSDVAEGAPSRARHG
jgi:hypothetical protein